MASIDCDTPLDFTRSHMFDVGHRTLDALGMLVTSLVIDYVCVLVNF